MRDALSAARERMNQTAAEPGTEERDEQQPQEGGGGGEMVAVHHHNHGAKHSKHSVMSDGTAKSEAHEAGQGGGDCPFCGGTGKAE